MVIRHVKNNSFTREENCSLYMLFLEEGIIKNLLSSNSAVTEYEQKLLKYAKNNKFKLSDIGTVSTANFNDMIKKYEFIIIKDKREVVLGYLCFERANLERAYKEENKEIIIIKHMYISNSQKHTEADYYMFWLMENLSEECVVYSDISYRPCNQFNGFMAVGKNYLEKTVGYLKIKTARTYPMFISASKKQKLYTMLKTVLNTQDRSSKI